MSLKAYDGMLSRKSLFQIEQSIKEKLPEFREASKDKLASIYANLVIEYFDFNKHPMDSCFFDFSRERDLVHKKEELEKKETTLLNLIIQISNALMNGYFINDFTVHLNITLEAISPRKTLVYPNILVSEHREILLEIFEDYYAQNQTDRPKNISSREWKKRKDDWWNFNETTGFKHRISLFSPQASHEFETINGSFKGEELIENILKYIPVDDSRVKRICREKFIQENLNTSQKEEDTIGKYMEIRSFLNKEEGQKELQKYIKNNSIKLTKIDKESLKTIVKPFRE